MDQRVFRSMVGRRIADFRKAAGIDQRVLAEQVGIDNTRLSRIETGERPIDTLTLRRLGAALHVSVDLLLADESPRTLVLARDPDGHGTKMRRWAEDVHGDIVRVISYGSDG